MNPDILWNLFVDTGAPELYLLYHKALQGACYVFEDRGTCLAGDGV